ncbi:hypothetical protein M8J77_017605 [Diaphorina citri]|nr:hypothetical protein M8J77_017605 [Diaphorina citri]
MLLPSSLLLILLGIGAAQGANILVIAPLATHSHAIWFDIVTTLLVKDGHQVTVLSSDPEKQSLPNRTTYTLETSYDTHEYEMDLGKMKTEWSSSVAGVYKSLLDWNIENCRRQKGSRGLAEFLEKFVRKTEKVDLIIREGAGSECYVALIHLLGYPPVIAATPFPNFEVPGYWIGNYDNPSYVPYSLTSYTDQMSLLQRLHNAYIGLYFKFMRSFYYLNQIDDLSKEIFGDGVPRVKSLDDHVVLAFVNHHPVLDYPRPTVPAFIPVPGLQLKPPKKLPQDIQSFLDGAKDGAIIFTFGSSLLTASISPAYRTMFFQVFSQLKQRVIWKWEMEHPADKPDNVMLAKWLPQADILGHNNTIAFISHCGQAGTQEAIYHAVPVLAIPFLLDQSIMAAKLIAKGVAIELNYEELTVDSVKSALDTLTTPTHGYKERMQKLSKLFRDTPEQSSDKIIFWTNYILNHGGKHLTPASKQLSGIQYYIIDVAACVVLTPIALVYLTRALAWLVRRQAKS